MTHPRVVLMDVPIGRCLRLVLIADRARELTAREVDFAGRFIALAGDGSGNPTAPPRRVVVVRPRDRHPEGL